LRLRQIAAVQDSHFGEIVIEPGESLQDQPQECDAGDAAAGQIEEWNDA
jgi:hypothetical protein